MGQQCGSDHHRRSVPAVDEHELGGPPVLRRLLDSGHIRIRLKWSGPVRIAVLPAAFHFGLLELCSLDLVAGVALRLLTGTAMPRTTHTWRSFAQLYHERTYGLGSHTFTILDSISARCFRPRDHRQIVGRLTRRCQHVRDRARNPGSVEKLLGSIIPGGPKVQRYVAVTLAVEHCGLLTTSRFVGVRILG